MRTGEKGPKTQSSLYEVWEGRCLVTVEGWAEKVETGRLTVAVWGGSSGASGFELRGADCGNRHGRSLQSSRYRERLEKEKRGRGKWPNSPAVRVATPHYIRQKNKK